MPATTTAHRQSQYMTEVRNDVKAIWNYIASLKNKQREWHKGSYGLSGGVYGLADGVGDNEGITAAEVAPCVFDACDALAAVLDGDHGGSLAKLL